MLPVCNAEAMQLHLDDIAAKVAPRAHAILIFDQAGWHGANSLKTPSNVSLIPLPPRAPELNPQENIWQYMRANSLSNRVFKSYDDIVDHCCYAWNTLVDQPLENHVHRPPRLGRNQSVMEPRKRQSQRSRLHDCAEMSASFGRVDAVGGSCIWTPSTPRAQTQA